MRHKETIYKIIGASNHCAEQRHKEDYYATEPTATKMLCRLETFSNPILEPACGEGHISKQLIEYGYEVVSRDIVDRGFGCVADFLYMNNEKWSGDIITNPPYNLAQEFVEQALGMVNEGNKVAMFLKLTFLEGKKRAEFFKKNPPCRIWVSSSRLKCAKNGDFEKSVDAVAYAWFVWEKGYKGNPELHWFN